MGYKILGYLVWNVGKRYAMRRFRDSQRGIAISAVAALMLAGLLGASRQRLQRQRD